MERFENLFSQFHSHARPIIADDQYRLSALPPHAYRYRCSTVLHGILDQVADEPAQQARVAVQDDGLTGDIAAGIPGRFFCSKCEQVDLVTLPEPIERIEPAQQ